MTSVHFRDEIYNDDRLFVLYVCRCTRRTERDGTVVTTAYHENPPPDAQWCVVTYLNTARYPATRVDHFESAAMARWFLELREPEVPLASLNGRSPAVPLSYTEFVKWKAKHHMKDYDHKDMYWPGGTNRTETFTVKP